MEYSRKLKKVYKLIKLDQLILTLVAIIYYLKIHDKCIPLYLFEGNEKEKFRIIRKFSIHSELLITRTLGKQRKTL